MTKDQKIIAPAGSLNWPAPVTEQQAQHGYKASFYRFKDLMIKCGELAQELAKPILSRLKRRRRSMIMTLMSRKPVWLPRPRHAGLIEPEKLALQDDTGTLRGRIYSRPTSTPAL